ncbi:hypothetical protein [Paracoccus chinensis]|uniref:Uncharacterized protein n=1 Tax=Paracoccus chinensis TaxID=525640 RepID=A0A1G9HBB4_9RHOB|nr:hypothetical protein [Paracoccus chinensis]SDL10152.1 hypothetical protein SAMN04487971_106106 [Paracoccus chinensis]
MKDLSAAERRLIAALDRLDAVVEGAAHRMATMQARMPAPRPAATAPVQGADPGLSPQIAALHDRQVATLEAMQARLAEAHERLAAAGGQAARLAAANDELAQANRALIEASASPEGWAERGEAAARAALQAEVEALRAAREAEVAQMGEILDALDRMLGVTTTPRSHSTRTWVQAAEPADRTDGGELQAHPRPNGGDEAGLPEDSSSEPIRELSVVRDEDPLPEDEPVLDLGAEDQPPRAGSTRPEAADSEKEHR